VIAFPVTEDSPALDSLTLMETEGRDLLRRVDLVIESIGIPAGHPLVSLLERLRLRPGEALRTVLDMSGEDLLAASAKLRKLATSYRDGLIGPSHRSIAELRWGGAGFEAFAARWAAQARHVAGPDDGSLAGRLDLTADFAESVAGWCAQVRQAMATTLVEAFGSTEAVTLKSCDALDRDASGLRRAVVTGEIDNGDRLAEAAANLGAVTLRTVSRWYDAAMETFLGGDWTGWLAPLPEPIAPTPGGPEGASAGWVRL